MVHVVQYVQVVQLAVIIVRVKALRHRFTELGMNIAKQFPRILCVLIEHKHKEVQI